MVATLIKLEIAFENVEVIEIPAKFISALNMHGMRQFRNSYQNSDEGLAMFRGTSAEKIYLQIDKSAKDKIFSSNDFELFARLNRWQDITSFELTYSDGFKEEIYTAWEGSDEKNNLQKNFFDDEGNLIVEIGKNF